MCQAAAAKMGPCSNPMDPEWGYLCAAHWQVWDTREQAIRRYGLGNKDRAIELVQQRLFEAT